MARAVFRPCSGGSEYMNWNGETGDRLNVDAHLVHVAQALLDRGEARVDVLHLLAVGRPGELTGEARRRLLLGPVDPLDHLVRGDVVDVAVDVDAEVTPLAPGGRLRPRGQRRPDT